jgi:hypothetical protein
MAWMSGRALWISEWMKKPAALAVLFYHFPNSVKVFNTNKEEIMGTGQGGKYPVPTNDIPSLHIEAYEITSSHKSEMASERVHPDVVCKFWIAD